MCLNFNPFISFKGKEETMGELFIDRLFIYLFMDKLFLNKS